MLEIIYRPIFVLDWQQAIEELQLTFNSTNAWDRLPFTLTCHLGYLLFHVKDPQLAVTNLMMQHLRPYHPLGSPNHRHLLQTDLNLPSLVMTEDVLLLDRAT